MITKKNVFNSNFLRRLAKEIFHSNLVDIKKIQIHVDCKVQKFDPWFLKSITITKKRDETKTYLFSCDRWLNEKTPTMMLYAEGEI